MLKQKKNARPKESGELSSAEIIIGTNWLCRISQREGYTTEYAALEKGSKIDQKSSILTLMPYLDENGLMRLYGRTDATDAKYLSEDAKRPILLPRNHRFTELLIHHYHFAPSVIVTGWLTCDKWFDLQNIDATNVNVEQLRHFNKQQASFLRIVLHRSCMHLHSLDLIILDQ